MQDRISRYPGRVRLTPVVGQQNVYDMVLADEPAQEGTKINKANLLTDATAALFGLGATAVPNDVFNKIKTSINASSGEISQRIRMITGAYIGDSVEYNTPNPRTISLGVYPLAVMVSLNGMDFGTFTNVSGGIAFRDNPVYAKPTVDANENLIEAITITSNGFVVDNYMANGCAAFTNRTNYGTYYYIAFY